MGADEEEVVEALEAFSAYRATSLDAPRGKDGADHTLGDTLGADEHGFTRAEQRTMLKQLMRVLTPRERIVLDLRFTHDLTQIEIGERIGVSQMQVSRILRQALPACASTRLHSTTREIADAVGLRPRSRAFARPWSFRFHAWPVLAVAVALIVGVGGLEARGTRSGRRQS